MRDLNPPSGALDTHMNQPESPIFGGGKRDRTDDLLHAMQALSQLSYTPEFLSVCTVLVISAQVYD